MNVEAFILIGGRSSRLGRDKALVKIGESTLAERALIMVRESGIASNICFVAGNEMQFAIEAARLDAPFVFDIMEGRGPLGGLHAALANATAEWIFLLACDFPLITSELCRILYGKISNEFGAVVPEQPDGRLQPLCAFYNVKTAKAVVNEIINKPRVSPPMLEIVAQLNPRIVRPDEYKPSTTSVANYFINVNTEEDLENAREIEGKFRPDQDI